jgi:hypothetical protein
MKPRALNSYTIAVQAYIYGFAAVEMERTRRILTNTAVTTPKQVPMNQILHNKRLVTAEDREVVTPNNDTPYSIMFLDLSKEPMLLHIPAYGDRYFTFPFMDAYTEQFCAIGQRKQGPPGQQVIAAPNGGDFAVVGPGWTGDLPADVVRIDSPTNIVWIIHRPLVDGPADLPALIALKEQITLKPLSAYGQDYTPPPGQVSQIDPDVAKLGSPLMGLKYFELLGDNMRKNSMPADEAGLEALFSKIGLSVQNGFERDTLDAETLEALEKASHDAKEIIFANLNTAGTVVNNWNYTLGNFGLFQKDYLLRAVSAQKGLGVLVPHEAIYPTGNIDDHNELLNGSHNYTLTFPAGQLPPNDGFWSLSMYGSDFFFVDNPLGRYAIGDRMPGLQFDADGSLTIYIQHESPGADKESNWLPAPKGGFYVIFRVYLPREEVLSLEYKLPPIKRVD